VDHHNHKTYPAKTGVNWGNTWLMKRASVVEQPACNEGNAPKTMGDAVKVEVYRSMPKRLSIRASPAGEPGIE
jgi:hypothetical protein